ncbi:MAG: permease [Paludibacter sp.]
MEQILKIATFILNSFIHIWPYLLITIPLSVIVQLSGWSKYISKALSKNPVVSIILATAIGAISPFCSCGVIPVIASLLIGGVPLAPVMSFWIASPSMDPEIFFLSVASIGWKLSVWRLAATFIISLSAGFITQIAVNKGYFGNEILRTNSQFTSFGKQQSLLSQLGNRLNKIFRNRKKVTVQLQATKSYSYQSQTINCCVSADSLNLDAETINPGNSCKCDDAEITHADSFTKKLLKETWKAVFMVAKFMSLAFLINALIEFYLPKELITNLLVGDSPFSVLIAALVGIPFYTSNITALPIVSGFLSLGMSQAAALAFLIAGPVTTLPAMMAVWGIVKPRVFLFYLLFSLFGAIVFGYLYSFLN